MLHLFAETGLIAVTVFRDRVILGGQGKLLANTTSYDTRFPLHISGLACHMRLCGHSDYLGADAVRPYVSNYHCELHGPRVGSRAYCYMSNSRAISRASASKPLSWMPWCVNAPSNNRKRCRPRRFGSFVAGCSSAMSSTNRSSTARL